MPTTLKNYITLKLCVRMYVCTHTYAHTHSRGVQVLGEAREHQILLQLELQALLSLLTWVLGMELRSL